MKKWPITTILLVATILLLAGALIGTLLYLRNQPPPVRGAAPLVTVAAQERDSAQWGLNFPNESSPTCRQPATTRALRMAGQKYTRS